EPAVAVGQETLADISPKDEIAPRNTHVDGRAEARGALPGHAGLPRASPRPVEEQVEAILLEDVERVLAARHRQLAIANARRRHASDARLVEQAELVAAEAIEPAAREPRAVDDDLAERAEEDGLGGVQGVLLVV